MAQRTLGTVVSWAACAREYEHSTGPPGAERWPACDVFLDENMWPGYLDGMQAAVFNALGEPNRLQIVELLRTSSFAVGEIAETLRIRQPQVSKHLKVLAGTGIVRVEPRARQRIYHLQAEPFDRIARWIDSFEHLWEVRLDSLGDYLQANGTEERQS